MTISPEIRTAYRYWRQCVTPGVIKTAWGPNGPPAYVADPCRRDGRLRARDALQRAREDVAAGVKRYPNAAGTTQGWQPASDDGARRVESLSAAGLRFVGFADEFANLRHTGWYTEDHGEGETLRGVVLQLPGKGGRARYVAAYADPNNAGAYRVDMSRPAVILGDVGAEGPRYDDGAREAARAADHFAERAAEKERDYNRAWSDGQAYADHGERIAAARKAALAILKERRQVAGVSAPTLCQVIRDKVEALLSEIRRARSQREQLAERQWREFYSAFNDGAGETVLS